MFKIIEFSNIWALGLFLIIPFYLYGRVLLLKKRAIPYSKLQYNEISFFKKMVLYFPLIMEVLIISIGICMLIGPYKTNSRKYISEKGVDIALVLDISASMQAGDFKPNRLEALKRISNDFIKRGGSNRITVQVFGKHVFTQSPLSSDHSVVSELIDGISYEMINHSKSGGTAIGDALLMASKSLLRYKKENRDQAVILITDGESNSGLEPELAAKFIKDNRIRLYTIGIGSKKPVLVYINGKPFINQRDEHLKTSLDDKQLKNITKIANGKYYNAKNENLLSLIFDEISLLESTPLNIETIITKKHYTSAMSIFIFVLFMFYISLEGFILRRPYR